MRPLFIVDAFSPEPFRGNPAGVCLLYGDEPDDWKQDIAAELNLAETAFVVRNESGFNLRWFTPICEVDLCGHATLAAAHILWQEGWANKSSSIQFNTRSGSLTCRCVSNGIIEMDFPIEPAAPTAIVDGCVEALGLSQSPKAFLANRMDYLVHVASAEVLRSLQPDFRKLASFPVRGWIVTSESDTPEYDFLSRFFGPAVGIDEDPVTGSAHCCLAEYWGKLKNRNQMIGYQASRRGGIVNVDLQGKRVLLSGQATTVFWGQCKSVRSGTSEV